MNLSVIGGNVSTSGPKKRNRIEINKHEGFSGLCEPDNASDGSPIDGSNGASDRAVAHFVTQEVTAQVDLSKAQASHSLPMRGL